MRYHIDAIVRGAFILPALAVLFGAMPARADDTPDAPHSEEIVRLWAVCPNARGYLIDWAHGVYLLTGVRNGRLPKIHSHEIKRAFPLEQWADWVGNVSASRHVVLIGVWDHTFRFNYTVIDKHDPLDFRVGPRARTMYDFWGVIDGEFRIISLGNPEAQQPGGPLTVRVFDPETLTVSEPGREAYQHVLGGHGLVVQEGYLIFRRVPDVSFALGVPDELTIEGKGFGVHWNDDLRTVLVTAKPGDSDALLVLHQKKPNHENHLYALSPRPAAFRVSWPWMWCGYGDEAEADSGQERSEVVTKIWRVFDFEKELWGRFSFEIRSDNKGLDILDEVIFWAKGEELWAVDLREAVEEGTTQPQLVWQDPLVPHIMALFYAEDGDGAQSNEDEPGESHGQDG